MPPAPRHGSRSGFTFLEALIALAVAALLVTVSAHSLTTIFRADRSAGRLLEGALLLRRVAANQYLGTPLENLPEEWPSGWSVATEPVTTGAGAEASRWKVARCSSAELILSIAFREP